PSMVVAGTGLRKRRYGDMATGVRPALDARREFLCSAVLGAAQQMARGCVFQRAYRRQSDPCRITCTGHRHIEFSYTLGVTRMNHVTPGAVLHLRRQVSVA